MAKRFYVTGNEYIGNHEAGRHYTHTDETDKAAEAIGIPQKALQTMIDEHVAGKFRAKATGIVYRIDWKWQKPDQFAVEYKVTITVG